MKRRAYIPKSKYDGWCTPPDLVADVHEAFGGRPDLDPCSGPKSVVGAKASYQPPADGLSLPWGPKGTTIFVNPPFSKADLWVHRCAFQALRGLHIILLLKAAVDTDRWYSHVSTARIVCFLKGRQTFLDETGRPAPHPAPFPVAMAAWNTSGFEDAFRKRGSLWVPVP